MSTGRVLSQIKCPVQLLLSSLNFVRSIRDQPTSIQRGKYGPKFASSPCRYLRQVASELLIPAAMSRILAHVSKQTVKTSSGSSQIRQGGAGMFLRWKNLAASVLVSFVEFAVDGGSWCDGENSDAPSGDGGYQRIHGPFVRSLTQFLQCHVSKRGVPSHR